VSDTPAGPPIDWRERVIGVLTDRGVSMPPQISSGKPFGVALLLISILCVLVLAAGAIERGLEIVIELWPRRGETLPQKYTILGMGGLQGSVSHVMIVFALEAIVGVACFAIIIWKGAIPALQRRWRETWRALIGKIRCMLSAAPSGRPFFFSVPSPLTASPRTCRPGGTPFLGSLPCPQWK
jgi:hypothetical protein